MSEQRFFSLEGLHEKPFFLSPQEFDVLVYPAEWFGQASFDPTLVSEISDIFYTRPYGRHTIYNLWTLFAKAAFLPWFESDVALGYRNLLSDAAPEAIPRVYYNDGFSLLQSAALKELTTETDIFRHNLKSGYTAIPLFPAALSPGVVTQLALGEGYNSARVSTLLEELNNFL